MSRVAGFPDLDELIAEGVKQNRSLNGQPVDAQSVARDMMTIGVRPTAAAVRGLQGAPRRAAPQPIVEEVDDGLYGEEEAPPARRLATPERSVMLESILARATAAETRAAHAEAYSKKMCESVARVEGKLDWLIKTLKEG